MCFVGRFPWLLAGAEGSRPRPMKRGLRSVARIRRIGGVAAPSRVAVPEVHIRDASIQIPGKP